VRSNGKRDFNLAFKTWLIEQALRPGVSVSGLSLQYGVNANQIRRWIKLARSRQRGAMPTLLPVTIDARPCGESTPALGASLAPAGPIELEIFGAKLKLHGEVDAQRLRVVLDVLSRRA
jgi:transposase